MSDYISIKHLKENNLKDINLDIPKHKLVVFTGVSGSGKSSVVFDTIASESQRQMNETYSAWIRSRLPKYKRPDVLEISDLSASVVVDQSRLGGNSRSTVGTISDMYSLLRLIYSRIGEPYVGSSSHFSFNDPSGMCPKCNGLGKVRTVDIESRIDKEKTWLEGMADLPAFHVGNWYYKQYIEHGSFPVDKKYKDFSEIERNRLLYGADYKGGPLIDKKCEGVYNYISRILLKRDLSDMKEASLIKLSEIINEETCPMCEGKRLNREVLRVKVNGYDINEMCEMEFTTLRKVLQNINDTRVQSVVDSLVLTLTRMIDIGLPYLSLNRESSSLSGGEAQRVKLVRYMGSSLSDMIYIFDEPSTGMHPRDVYRMCDLLKSLRDKGNTVLVVEHDKDIISIADVVIDMGPLAGKKGGEVCFQGTYKELLEADTLTAKAMKQFIPLKEDIRTPSEYLPLSGCNTHNLKNIDVEIPLNVLTVVSGVAGSGKSSLIREEFVNRYKDRVVLVDQSPITATDRSSPVTFLGIFDEIRKLFAKANNVDVSLFSYNSSGACPVCKGKGVIVTELAFMEPVVTECESCGGKRYSRETLNYLYKGKNITEVLNMNNEDALEFFDDVPKIKKVIKRLIEVGLGYLSLGQPSSTLSGGERQRLKLAKYLDDKGNIYVLDEPTTGLHSSDISKLMDLFEKIVDKGNTVIIIEHNMDVMKRADYIIDIGPDGGRFGGEVVYSGTVKNMIENSSTITAECLKANIEGRNFSHEELKQLVKTKVEELEGIKRQVEQVIDEEDDMKLEQIGKVDTKNEKFSVVIDEKYKKALKGLEGFSHVQVVYWFDGCDNEKDRNLLIEEEPYTKGPKELGVFSTRSPFRPNPIGISVCEVKDIDYEKGIINLYYIDAYNDTAVLDIKPYTPSIDRVKDVKVPKWCDHWPKNYEDSEEFDWSKEFNF